MKYKYVIMQEMEETNTAIPFLIVDDEVRAEILCYEYERDNPGFIFWTAICAEE